MVSVFACSLGTGGLTLKTKHWFLILIAFLMLGTLIVVPSMMISSNSHSQIKEDNTPEEMLTIAADEPLKELKLNVNDNPSFEKLGADDWPNSYGGSVTGYKYTNPNYTSIVHSGNYSGYVASQGIVGSSSNIASLIKYVGYNPDILLTEGLTLDYYWNTLNNHDIDIGSYVYFRIRTTNSTGYNHEILYFLSNNAFSTGNSSSRTSYMWNFSIGNWNHFSRNITSDYDANPSIGPADSTRRITYLDWYASTTADCRNRLEFVVDDVVLSNETYSSWVVNGDFESGDGQNWMHYDSTPIYVSQSTDSTDGTYSLNMTSGVVVTPSATASGFITRSYSYPTGYYVSKPSDILVEFDWKYNRILGSAEQSASFVVRFENETDSYYYHFYLGFGADTLVGVTNDTTDIFIGLNGFNVRGTWHHAELDLYDYISEFGSLDGTVDRFEFDLEVPGVGSQSNLLIDDFKIIATPTGDPGFEQDWYEDVTTPFAGWSRFSVYSDTQARITDAFSGRYACNITPYFNFDNQAGVFRTISFPVSPDDFLNAWWRLDAISNHSQAYAAVRLELVGGYSLNYMLGRAAQQGEINSTWNVFFDVKDFNTTGSWTNLYRNITDDAVSGLGLSGNMVIEDLIIRARSGGADSLVTLIIDDVMITDGAPPIIESVEQLPVSPMYYDAVDIHVNVFDLRPGIDHVIINYTTNGGTTWNSLLTNVTYDATIPAQIYGTLVEYYVIAEDGVGLETVDNNNGSYYLYVVDDDIYPLITIDSPSDMDDVWGDMTIEVTANDTSSGIEYVEFFLGESLLTTDYAAPYSHYVYLEIYDLGEYTINVTAHDYAGNLASDSINITIIDGIPPDLDAPNDIVFQEGTLGQFIEWDPTDTRPARYEVYINNTLSVSGDWNSSSERVRVSLDGLSAGLYNYTCVVYDDGGNIDVDTVMVMVNAQTPTTTPEQTATEPTTSVPTSPSTTPEPTDGIPLEWLLIAAGGILLLIALVACLRKK